MVFLLGERLPYGIISGGVGEFFRGEEFPCDTRLLMHALRMKPQEISNPTMPWNPVMVRQQ